MTIYLRDFVLIAYLQKYENTENKAKLSVEICWQAWALMPKFRRF